VEGQLLEIGRQLEIIGACFSLSAIAEEEERWCRYRDWPLPLRTMYERTTSSRMD